MGTAPPGTAGTEAIWERLAGVVGVSAIETPVAQGSNDS